MSKRPSGVVNADSPIRRMGSTSRYAGVILLAALALVPLWLGDYGRSLVTETLLFCIFAMSLDLLMGYTGLISFGHAAFFGLGAYTVAVLGALFGIHPVLGALAAICLAAPVAVAIGFFCIRASGVYFIMLTLAFAQLLYTVSIKWRSVTGGAGALFAMHNGFVSPSVLFWMLSGEGMIMVVLGGMGTLVGPMIGAAVFLLLKHFVSLHSAHWELLVGATFIACVMFFKQGIYGWFRERWAQRSRP